MALGPPVVPRPAATVVLMRGRNDRREVFLTRRPTSMAFLGGYYVFPGGRLDAADLRDEVTRRVVGVDPGDAEKIGGDGESRLGFYTAAVRELFEESGVLLLCDESGRIVPGEIYREMRDREGAQGAPFVDEVIGRGLFFAGGRLRFLQVFTTPAFAPIRFHTVFFVAELPEGQEAGIETPEVERSFWIAPGEALEKNRSGEFPMIPPTMAALHIVGKR